VEALGGGEVSGEVYDAFGYSKDGKEFITLLSAITRLVKQRDEAKTEERERCARVCNELAEEALAEERRYETRGYWSQGAMSMAQVAVLRRAVRRIEVD